MVRGLSATLLAGLVEGHADFFMADASFRKSAKGSMYCGASFDAGETVMGKEVLASSSQEIDVERLGATTLKVSISAPSDVMEYIFETDVGAFTDGGCKGRRSLLQGGTLEVPADATSVTLKAAYANCVVEPPIPCQVNISTKVVDLTSIV